MSTLDDKLLGEKKEYYCSSSEDEDIESGLRPSSLNIVEDSAYPVQPPTLLSPGDSATNTGPKGVINDWRKFQELKQKREQHAELERMKLMEKLSMKCKPYSQEVEEKAKQEKLSDDLDKMLEEEDPFLNEYMKKRMQEMMEEVISNRNSRKFGQLIQLNTGDEFLDAIEKENAEVLTIIHISNNSIDACKAMNGCLSYLASQYPYIRFCTLDAYAAGMSKRFEKQGVPALLVYKNGHLIGNFVRLSDEFGEDFFATDVETYLIDHGFLPDGKLIPDLIKERTVKDGTIKCGIGDSDEDD